MFSYVHFSTETKDDIVSYERFLAELAALCALIFALGFVFGWMFGS